ncbi:LOW QUALITY PROTEIN: uncharacterized protein [Panulirus ornatus]|uniref:LOW QUALITY PROTEIN: uncharacterized protein n=1 Tax=Panulirus ornatus TaxID=150431 RepID=UPI003A8B679D
MRPADGRRQPVGLLLVGLWAASWLGSAFPAGTEATSSVLLYSTFSWGGLRGNATFSWGGPGTNVTVEIDVEIAGTSLAVEEPEEYSWAIHEWPVRYDIKRRCSTSELGSKKWDLSRLFGKLTLPQNASARFETDQLDLVGDDSIWSRSLRISGKRTTCSNLHGVGGERTYESKFLSPIGGSIWLRTWAWDVGVASDVGETKGTQTILFSDVFNTADDDPVTGEHNWSIFITDILDEQEDRPSCNFLSRIYDPEGRERCEDGKCPLGDLTNSHGLLKVGSRRSRFSRKLYSSTKMVLPNLSGPRKLYLAVMGTLHPDHLWACAKLREIKPKSARAIFNSNGVRGEVRVDQASIFTPTDLTLDLKGLGGQAGGFHVHELPAKPPRRPGDFPCGATKGHYNPYEVDKTTSPEAGLGAHDQYELGDLSGKHGLLTGLDEVSATVTDHNLPLLGPRSVMSRSLVIHKTSGDRWICSNLRPTVPQMHAVVTFRYPLVGEIVFEQDADDYLADTQVLVSYMVYSDGSKNTQGDHRWHIHDHVPGKDFYNWTMRCVSAGDRYNPYKVSSEESVYRSCSEDVSSRCLVGDLATRHGRLKVSGTVRGVAATQSIITDTNLPLSGPNTILGHSVVIHDDHAPKHRGDRMACSGIYRRFRHKGVASKWHATRGAGNVEGKVEFIQESEYDLTNSEVDLRGLTGIANGYHVHMVPIEDELEFPCAAGTTLGHYNPLNVTPSESPPPTQGTDDLYEMGDLAGKYGTLEGLNWKRGFYNDTNLQLFGSTSIMGRSIVIHKKEKNARWFCGSIGWGYSPSEATQVSAIASFHNPQGYAWGYVRMRQLVYRDDSFGETFIEINLRHPGTNNRNVTRRHNWSVYVNPVGVDAGVKFFQSRCVAAGYRWNPYLIHLAFPNDRDFYERECSPEVPLRCDVGDLSGRLGTIDVGDKRYVFVDQNLPLRGPHGIMNRAIIIHNENAGVERFACANIEPDDDIIKWVNLKKVPKFSAPTFMDDVREVLGAPEWYLAADLQTVTLSSDLECVTFVVHFKGPQANQLELDFSRILAGGIVHHPTISIRGVYPDPKRPKKVPYRTCGGLEEDDILKDKSKSWWKVLTGDLEDSPSSAPSVSHTSVLKLVPLVAFLRAAMYYAYNF